MKIKRWDEESLRKIGDYESGNGTMVVISPEEALKLIRCLSNQLLTRSSSPLGRKEFFDEEGEYFSIVVETNKGLQL